MYLFQTLLKAINLHRRSISSDQ